MADERDYPTALDQSDDPDQEQSDPGPTLAFVADPRYVPLIEGAEASAASAGGAGLGPVATALGTVGAIIAAAGGVVLAGESIRAAAAGEKTPIEVADNYYHTHLGDMWGWWVKGDYANEEKRRQLEKATADSEKTLSNSPANQPTEQCPHKAVIPDQEYTDQTCLDERLGQLQDQLKDNKKPSSKKLPFKPSKRPYDESNPAQRAKKKLLCDYLREREQAHKDLIKTRDQIQEECFNSPKTTEDEKERDDSHKTERRHAEDALKKIQNQIAKDGCP